MINLFGKKKEPVTVYVGDAPLKITEKEFNRVVHGLKDQVEKLNERNGRLERIIKYAPFDSDKIGCHLESYTEDKPIDLDIYLSSKPVSRFKYKKRLYIYHNREEYAVELEELTDCIFVNDSQNIKWINKKDSLVEFTVMTHKLDFSFVDEAKRDVKKHVFTINFKSGKYLYKCDAVEVGIVDDCKKED